LTESQFIKKNQKDWLELEGLLRDNTVDADKLNRLFVKVSSDLSYARTFYPNRSVRLYLNNLTQSVFDTMRVKEDKFSPKQIGHFFSRILPQEIYNSRKALIVSFCFFVLAMGIGVISSVHDEDFTRLILGDSYVDMTEENIKKGDPMAVYKDERKLNMFFGITTNNIRVAFLAFVLGFIGSVGTVVVLLYNGIMLGTFQYFFYAKGLFWTSFLTIWIHGTIEISAIIIAGGAGIVLGNGLLFPKTYSRMTSLQITSLRALRLILGTIPLFIMAGILESYVTRQTDLPTLVKASIIGLSFLLILFMWVIYPIYYNYRKKLTDVQYDIEPKMMQDRAVDKYSYRTLGEVLGDGFLEFRTYLGINFQHATIPTFLLLIPIVWLHISYLFDVEDQLNISFYLWEHGGIFMTIFYWLAGSYLLTIIIMTDQKTDMDWASKWTFLKKYGAKIAATTLLFYIPYTIIPFPYVLITLLVLSPQLYVIIIDNIISDGSLKPKLSMKECLIFSYKSYMNYIVIGVILVCFMYAALVLFHSPLISLVEDYIHWHHIMDTQAENTLFISHLMHWILLTLIIPLMYYLMRNAYLATRTKDGAIDLNRKLIDFGKGSSIFES